MSKRSLTLRFSGALLVLWGLAPPAPAAEKAASPSPGEQRLQAIQGRLDLLELDYRRLQAVPAGDLPGGARAAGEALGEVRRSRDRLETWLARAEREPYRSNLDRFLRDLERRPVSRVHWQWGDGKENDSPFPATHMYEPGNEWVMVYATAFDAVGMESERAAKQLHLWDCLAPGSCGQPETRELFNLSLDSTHLIQACTDIVMGPGFHVLEPADLTIRAGGSVELRNGVYIEGGRVAIENDPSLLP